MRKFLQQFGTYLRKKGKLKPEIKRINFVSESDLSFSNIHGGGIIQCKECGFSKKIIGFTHGAFDCDIGRQCQHCGTFFAEHNESEQYHTFGPRVKPVLCPHCRKEYTDEETYNTYPLFCPDCKSKELGYRMVYIT